MDSTAYQEKTFLKMMRSESKFVSIKHQTAVIKKQPSHEVNKNDIAIPLFCPTPTPFSAQKIILIQSLSEFGCKCARKLKS